jgi:hypothetical protein
MSKNLTYLRRKEQEICVWCESPAIVPPHVACATCLAASSAWSRKRRKDNPELVRKLNRDYRVKNCVAVQKQVSRRARVLKEEALNAYGGVRCACCGEEEIRFLCLDHIRGGGEGERDRKRFNNSVVTFYRWLKKQGFPSGFQVLCFNCNFGKGRGPLCPHQTPDPLTRPCVCSNLLRRERKQEVVPQRGKPRLIKE